MRRTVELAAAAVAFGAFVSLLGCSSAPSSTGTDTGGRGDGATCPRPPCDDGRDVGRGGECTPACQAGEVCLAGACVEGCNPPCSPGFACDSDRVCQPIADSGFDDTRDDADGSSDAEPDSATDGSDDTPPPTDVTNLDVPASDTSRPDVIVPPTGCAEATIEAGNVLLPADIIFAVDTSGSMSNEREMVQRKLNEFTAIVSAMGIDVRVVMVASSSVCIPPPLSGAPGCPDTDGPDYRHIVHRVDSSEVFSSLLDTVDLWSDFLRPRSSLHFVAVTDANDDQNSADFRSFMQTRLSRTFRFHAIVATTNICGFNFNIVGQRYIDLARATLGVVAPICTDDWDAIILDIARSIAVGARLPCDFGLPDAGPDVEFDPERVNVYFTPAGGEAASLPYIDRPSDCEGGRSAWYYDNPRDPERIILCPTICGEVDGEITVEFGCDTIKL